MTCFIKVIVSQSIPVCILREVQDVSLFCTEVSISWTESNLARNLTQTSQVDG